MSARQLLAVCLVGVLLESVVLAVQYDDLLYLRLPAPVLASGPRDLFLRRAAAALQRPKLTRQHLETVAAVAQDIGNIELEIQALERIVGASDDDRRSRLRLADAWRRGGKLDAAEEAYLTLLGDASGGKR
jgi:hypothetical protein